MLRAVLALRLREPKIQKSKTLLRGPKLLDFLVFLGFFGFPTKIQKNTWCFLVFQQNPTKHRVFLVFHQRPNKKTKKTCVFFGFPPKIQKKPCDFLDFCWKTRKTLGKPKNPKVSGPSERFWIFGFLIFWFPPKALQNQKSKKSKTLLRGPKLLDFWFS